MKQIIKVIMVNIILIVLLAEMVIRLYPTPFEPPPYNTAELDDKLGWRQKEAVYTIDRYHWTEIGHRIVGENLRTQLQRLVHLPYDSES